VISDLGQFLERRTRISIHDSVGQNHAGLGFTDVHENTERLTTDDDSAYLFALTQQGNLLMPEPGV
jgi:hypothetical protein